MLDDVSDSLVGENVDHNSDLPPGLEDVPVAVEDHNLGVEDVMDQPPELLDVAVDNSDDADVLLGIDEYSIPPEVLAECLEPLLSQSEPYVVDSAGESDETSEERTIDSFDITSDSFEVSGEEDAVVDYGIDEETEVAEEEAGLSGRADVDEELDETIPYEIEEITAGSSLTYGPNFQQKSAKTTKK